MFRIVVVCTGNRCRSPLLAAHLSRLTEELPVEVDSMGTIGIAGMPVPPELVEVVSRTGLDLSAHASKALDRAGLSQADLVLGMERDHVAAAVVDGGARPETAFMVKELLRLTQGLPPPPVDDVEEMARLVVKQANGSRRFGRFVRGEEVRDPFGGSLRDYERSADEVAALARDLVGVLFGR